MSDVWLKEDDSGSEIDDVGQDLLPQHSDHEQQSEIEEFDQYKPQNDVWNLTMRRY